jgi:hypothetical protein
LRNLAIQGAIARSAAARSLDRRNCSRPINDGPYLARKPRAGHGQDRLAWLASRGRWLPDLRRIDVRGSFRDPTGSLASVLAIASRT